MGVVMIGRVIIGDIAATLTDLAIRKLLRVGAPPPGGSDGWLLRSLLASAPRYRAESLLGYERALLRGLARRGSPVSLPALDRAVLDQTRRKLIADAVHRGWVHRLDHHQRTPAGEDLARRISAFQRDLRRLRSRGGTQIFAGDLLPYALHFGMAGQDESPLARFAHAFVGLFAGLEGWREPEPPRPDFYALDRQAADRF
jgi:hypothetical protein